MNLNGVGVSVLRPYYDKLIKDGYCRIELSYGEFSRKRSCKVCVKCADKTKNNIKSLVILFILIIFILMVVKSVGRL